MLAGFYWAVCLDRDSAVPEIICVSGVSGISLSNKVFRFGDEIPWGLSHFRIVSGRLTVPV